MAGRAIRVATIVLIAGLMQPDDALPDDARLTALLSKIDRVASLYRDNALRFACEETITYSSSSGIPAKVYRLEYVYEHNEAGELSDYRTDGTRPRNKTEVLPRVELGNYGIPYYLLRAYSWVFIFERGKWKMYDYELGREEHVLGRGAIRIGFEPVLPIKEDLNDWYGTAWIDKETSQILKVEALKADQHREKSRLEADRGRPDRDERDEYVFARIKTDFAVEKHGMRFPSSVEIVKSRFRFRGREYQKPDERQIFRVTQAYDNYRFFAVRTFDQIRDIVSGPAPAEGIDQ
jgi:hypothetical protein